MLNRNKASDRFKGLSYNIQENEAQVLHGRDYLLNMSFAFPDLDQITQAKILERILLIISEYMPDEEPLTSYELLNGSEDYDEDWDDDEDWYDMWADEVEFGYLSESELDDI